MAFLNNHGGDPRNVGADYIEAYVPTSLLGPLSQQPGVLQVRKIVPPQPAQLVQQVIGNGPAVHGSQPWNEAGYNGQGIKVGIIDDFKDIRGLMGTELPQSVVARCYTDIGDYSNNLSDCLDFDPPEVLFPQCQDAFQARADRANQHGTWVAEAVVDLAPDVTLYIANPFTKGDMQETADWMAAQGVSVINLSAGWTFDGPGDGTSPLSISPLNTVDRVVASDVLWVNSAGNAAEDTWFGSYFDPDGDGAHGFATNNDEIMGLDLRECSSNGFQLRWEDSWTAATTDLDFHLYHMPTQSIVLSSDDVQAGGAGDIPFERLGFQFSVDSNDYGLVVTHEGGPVPDWIQITAWTSGRIEHHTLTGSITNPAESANPGLLAVGAAPWYDVHTIEDFSSRGPTPDGRTKPEVVAADCGASALLPLNERNRGFCGTSQSSPHMAGMAALVRQRFPDLTAEQVASYLKDNAQPRGAVPNNTWGYGLAQLPATGVGECVHELTTDGTTPGTWAAGCQSHVAERGFAQYYSFTLEEASQVTINLTSSVDPYLLLRAGEARSGDFLYQNDDIESGNTNSRITASLPAGSYTIEATTYNTGQAGPFTLTVTGLGTVGDGTGMTDACGQMITGDGTTPGTWTADCQSMVADRGYARYYIFTLAQQSAVTIDLESTLDTYLYLREGEARSGAFLHENDDVAPGSDTDSRITQTLPAGTYTIEATTYAADQTGNFTLTISGLGGETTTSPGTGVGETDTCGETITEDGATPGTWAAGCQSQVSGRGYARYYTFTLDEATEVTIDLESSVDTYLYLREGEARSGAFLHENDDVAPGSDTDSRIRETLAAGTYTIEATTYAAAETGIFTLTISGLGGDTTTSPGTGNGGADQCGETITEDGAISGTWAAGCQSMVADRGYARYYTFSLAQESAVTIDLESSVDTYLYLREGEARSGTAPHSNDDIESGNLNSRIRETLSAGTYTIEATTYAAAQTGTFTLTISGLGGETTTSPGTGVGETDTCGETITEDGTSPGTWAAGCQSSVSGRGYARYYTFTLAQQSAVTIGLDSSVDTYLYLREGEARSGTAPHSNDDIESGNLNSRIRETLSAGTYTIEATTYAAAQTGTFTLTISGLGGDTMTSPGTGNVGADQCGETITEDGATSGAWAAGCQSQVSGRGYARYYSFSLGQESMVTVDLESSVDTYLYLREGEARSGTALHFNDDVVPRENLNSQVSETLAAGTYTIEATTYNPATEGSFTLTISGLD